jgi:thiamine biosynthesis lipoprotein
LPLAGCRTPVPPRLEQVRRGQPLLGTFVTITAHGPDRADLHQAISAAFAEIRRVDELLSVHRADSEISRLNAAAGQGPVEVSPELHAALASARKISEKTAGAFDVTIGPIAQLWGFIWKEYRLPTDAELERVLPLVGDQNLALHPNQTVSLLKPGMLLDFGGLGKGIAVDRAIETLRARGVRTAMVKAGGDLRVIGLPPGQEHWEVQLEDPAKEGRRNLIYLTTGALSTSGSYENYFEVEGRRYSHIIDPRTGLPVQGVASCTVLAPTCAESDALATAFFVLGVPETLARFGQTHAVRFITSQMQVIESPRFRYLQYSPGVD